VKVGDTISIRKPVSFTVVDGATATASDVTELKDTIQISKQKHVAWKFTMKDMTLTIEEYSERYIKPAALALANQVDVDVATLYKDVAQSEVAQGTAGTDPTDFSDIALIGKALDNASCPNDELYLMMNPNGYWTMANGLSNVYNETINKKIMRSASLGRFGNFDIFQSQNVQTHVGGVQAAATSAVNGAAKGTVAIASNVIPDGTLPIKGLTSGDTFKVGDVFTIAGVNSVNSITKADTGNLKRFVVTTALTATATAMTNLIFKPGMLVSGDYQNVSATNADSAALTWFPLDALTTGRSVAQNLAYHKNAFALVVCPLDLPEGAGWAVRATHENISVRLVKDYDFKTDEEKIRMDILYGTKAIYPELAVRLWGA
jgi:hypothetical protein